MLQHAKRIRKLKQSHVNWLTVSTEVSTYHISVYFLILTESTSCIVLKMMTGNTLRTNRSELVYISLATVLSNLKKNKQNIETCNMKIFTIYSESKYILPK